MTETRRPLDGIRVLELAQVVAGPFCGALMAEFGAEVIKTEIPGRGDDLRRLGPTEDGCTYWFAVDNRNKKLMTLDLHLPKGQDIVRRLVTHCDVVLENFRPGVLERWGLGWEALHAINPRLVMARITAFGQTGPLNQGPGYAAIGSAFGPGGACETQGGKSIVFTAPAQHLFERLCAMIGQPELPRDPRFASATERPQHIPVILDLMTKWFAARPFEKALAELKGADI